MLFSHCEIGSLDDKYSFQPPERVPNSNRLKCVLARSKLDLIIASLWLLFFLECDCAYLGWGYKVQKEERKKESWLLRKSFRNNPVQKKSNEAASDAVKKSLIGIRTTGGGRGGSVIWQTRPVPLRFFATTTIPPPSSATTATSDTENSPGRGSWICIVKFPVSRVLRVQFRSIAPSLLPALRNG